jgi:FKBP-type peptidyl-prolyl cis-trans isomerase
MISVPLLTILAVAVLCTIQVSTAADMTKYYQRTGAKYLRTKAAEEGVITLQSGMLVEILKEGSDADAKSPLVGGE